MNNQAFFTQRTRIRTHIIDDANHNLALGFIDANKDGVVHDIDLRQKRSVVQHGVIDPPLRWLCQRQGITTAKAPAV